MKTGYSNLLQHLVEAQTIPHKGCATLQVVCPECREPVYKTERSSGDGMQHFLCHYPDTKSDVSRCELRVNALTTAMSMGQVEIEGRGQNLKFFLAIIDRVLDETAGHLVSPEHDGQIRRSRMVRQFAPYIRDQILLIINGDDPLRALGGDAEYQTRTIAKNMFGRPRLDIDRQRSYAWDLLRTMLTAQCATAYRNLFRMAVHASMLLAIEIDEDNPDAGYDRVFECLLATIMDNPDRMPVNDFEARTCFDLMATMVSQILMNVDYVGWLQRRQEDPALQKVRWVPDRIAPVKPKRKPKPKRTHRR